MDGIEATEFLQTQPTGVLSLADENDSYAIPVSYAYDEDDRALYFRLGFAPGSQKRGFIEATDHATFVTYADTAGGWQSVVAEGRLEELTDDAEESGVLEFVKDLDIPYFQVHERPADDLSMKIYRLNVGKLSGVVEGQGHD
jgi:hypothetical protein